MKCFIHIKSVKLVYRSHLRSRKFSRGRSNNVDEDERLVDSRNYNELRRLATISIVGLLQKFFRLAPTLKLLPLIGHISSALKYLSTTCHDIAILYNTKVIIISLNGRIIK